VNQFEGAVELMKLNAEAVVGASALRVTVEAPVKEPPVNGSPLPPVAPKAEDEKALRII
jgi:hypothetical protein